MFAWRAIVSEGDDVIEVTKASGVPLSKIPREKILAFDILHNGDTLIRVNLLPDYHGSKSLIYRKRTRRDMGTGLEQVLHIVGWQRVMDGTPVHSLIIVDEATGEIILDGEPGTIVDPIEPFPWETDLVKVEVVT